MRNLTLAVKESPSSMSNLLSHLLDRFDGLGSLGHTHLGTAGASVQLHPFTSGSYLGVMTHESQLCLRRVPLNRSISCAVEHHIRLRAAAWLQDNV
jgi:hypothetical protein